MYNNESMFLSNIVFDIYSRSVEIFAVLEIQNIRIHAFSRLIEIAKQPTLY